MSMPALDDTAKAKESDQYRGAVVNFTNREWRLDNLYWIRNEAGEAIPFKRNAAQRAYHARAWHRDLIPKARKLGFCHDPSMRVLTADLRWVRIDDIQVGQQIVAVDEDIPGGKGKQRKMRLAVVEAKRDIFDVAYKIRLDSGVELIATGAHRYMSKKRPKGDPKVNGRIQETIWRTVHEMRVGDLLRYVNQPWSDPDVEDGWMGGLLDGEGSLRQKPKGGFEITISQTAGPVLDRARKYLADRGYTFYETIDSRTRETAYGTRTKPLHKLIIHRMNEAFRLIGQTRPTRFINTQWWKDRDLPGKKSGMAWSEVVSIEKLETRRMVDIQTSAKTFICEGVVSHNSTFIAILICDECVFRKGTIAGIVDKSLDDACDKLAMIRFAYERLPLEVRTANKLVIGNQQELSWANGSSVTVGTSYRGGTPRLLHVSEYGIVSANKPDVAREIKTGAIQAVPALGKVWVESTTHGASGEFFEMVRRAENAQKERASLTPLDFRLHFYGWWIKKEYRLPNNLVIVPHALREYFAKIAPTLKARYGVELDADQEAWYTKKYQELGPDDVKQEYPSLPEEMFYLSVEGAFWKAEMSKARSEGRIGQMVPHDPSRSVNTSWDIGEDCTSIIFHQSDGLRHRLIDCWEDVGSSLQAAIGVVDQKRIERKFVYAEHYGPHDLENRDWGNSSKTRKEMAEELGLRFTVVPRIQMKADSIEAARRFLATCFFDSERTGRLVECLDNYSKKWNERMAMWMSDPNHNWASHFADSLQCLAMGWEPDKLPNEGRYRRREERRTTQWAS